MEREQKMRIRPLIAMGMALGLIVGAGIRMAAQNSQPPAPASAPPQAAATTCRLTIEIKGGEKNVPVENASVYVKYIEERKLSKDKKLELNVKTNREGLAHVQEAPLGRALVQIVAEGWKTYGRWYDVTEAKQTISIHLEKPPKWY
jgi:hypothetical protein